MTVVGKGLFRHEPDLCDRLSGGKLRQDLRGGLYVLLEKIGSKKVRVLCTKNQGRVKADVAEQQGFGRVDRRETSFAGAGRLLRTSRDAATK